MRRLLVLASALLWSVCVFAQNKDTVQSGDLFPSGITTISEGKGELMRFHGNLIFSESNEYLLSSDVTGQFWRKYNGAKILQDYGQYIWMLGLSYMASDIVFIALYRDGNTNFFKDPSLIVGGIFTLVGAAMDFGGWVRLGNLAKTYNTDPSVRKSYSLNLGPTNSGGFGLSFNF
ncbi:MAG: hypothetical protein IKW99_07750 [Bacteroidales bacterium]|nr:hypothetical protein [Bacteroidales bacterium]